MHCGPLFCYFFLVYTLLKNGSKVWPVHVVNHRFRDNWSNFLKDQGVKPGYNIVFGCHKQWIFDVIILNKELDRVQRSWNTSASILYQIYYPPYMTKTSCLPSIMQRLFQGEQFGCVFQNIVRLTEILEEKMHHHLHDGELKEVCIRTGNRRWKIPVLNGKLSHWSMTKFVEHHKLGPTDFHFFGISDDGTIQGLIFARHGGERTYCWF